MLRKFFVFGCLGMFAMSMAACSGPGEISTPTAEEKVIPGNSDLAEDDPDSGIATGFE